MLRFFLSIVLCMCPGVWLVIATAQTVQFQQLDMDDGLSHNNITAILKDDQGFLWFGTPAGLNRYDGHQVKLFRHIPKDMQSLMDNGINDLFMGPEGRLWVKTQMGYNIYDARTARFIRNADSVLMEMGIPAGDVLSIKQDSMGRYWFLHGNGQLYGYDAQQHELREYRGAPGAAPFTSMSLGGDGSIWLVSELGLVQRLDPNTLAIQWSESIYTPATETRANYKLFIDRDGRPWVYAKNVPIGVYWWPDIQYPPKHLHTQSEGVRLNNNFVTNIDQDVEGRMWLATDHGGINLFDKKDHSMAYLVNDEFNDRSLSHNSTTTLYRDVDGMMWVGTFKGGLSYYHQHQVQFPLYRSHRGDPTGLPFDDVNCFVEDQVGNIWIGTNGGGLIYFNRRENRFTQYTHNPKDPYSLSSDVIVSLYLDKAGVLWVGTYYGGLNRFDGRRFVQYKHNPSNSKSISDNSVWEIYEDSKGRFWIGTLSGGVNLMDRQRGTFTPLGFGADGGPRSSYVSVIMEDHEHNIWFGTEKGVEVLEQGNGQYRYFSYDSRNANSLSNDYVADILEDSRHRIWVATREGLNLYRPGTMDFDVFRVEDGLPDNSVLTIEEDMEGTIWVSTAKGLSAIRQVQSAPRHWRFRNYDRRDGLQATAFNENAARRLVSGELLFGGPSGFNIIDPSRIVHTSVLPKPVLTDFQLFNRSIILPTAPSHTRKITLPHDQNVLSLEVASLYFLHKDGVYFRYKLEGFGEEWLVMDNESRKATFTNLDPGDYRFKVMTSTDNESWSDEYTLVDITILPPFWKTGWAYFAYLVVFVSALLLVRHIERMREKTRFALRQEREEARRIRELDRMKTRFFTNVSHEFRTPISLILAPLDKLASEATDDSTRQHLILVQRNAKRLLNLVNQLLDFRKIDTQVLQLNPEKGDIAMAIQQHFGSFTDLAERKRIDYRLSMPETHLYVWFDHDKLERILFNLLSNAFKFTPVGGQVTVDVSFTPESMGKPEREMTITVRDTGIGIPQENQARIFDRYFQHDTPPSMLNQGSGIGLAIVKEYTLLLNGKIDVESIPNEGSAFTVTIPLMEIVNGDIDVAKEVLNEQPLLLAKASEAPSTGSMRRVLLVEDDEDFRFYLKDNLRAYFSIQEAKDAEEGWSLALAFHPDIIVSDVSMPGDDGVAFCLRLKKDNRTRHIPLILLTAMADESTQLAGIKAGAADYIIKPFNFELLRSKVSSLLKQREAMERTFRKQLDVRPEEKKVISVDEQFMRKALDVITRNMGNPNFSVELLAREMNISRVGLYKRILTLSGYTPSEFIRNIRLRQAAQLLEQSGMNVAEVAYEVGFGNPKQFSKYFKSLYNTSPSAYRKET
ncbi:hybrid sensor histidine kinase/response regulator transcription factor [Parapedobacter tibetensis]|uniref:hybrid sensor histidine kinase/response regulator transcription factor n=1 Tax=Parapedobacter tibetensis TaxID=2972951 RepID=UPI00214DE3F2|nr:two-component regulator propeller domain-containing protein [Parapedobacter tibetensis]